MILVTTYMSFHYNNKTLTDSVGMDSSNQADDSDALRLDISNEETPQPTSTNHDEPNSKLLSVDASVTLQQEMKELSLGRESPFKLTGELSSGQTHDEESDIPQIKSTIRSSAHLKIDEQLKDMIDMAEKAVIVLSLHFNDCCDGKVEVERAKIALIGLHEVVSFIGSLPLMKKIAIFSELLSKALFVEMLCAYFMRHWTGMYLCGDTTNWGELKCASR